MPKKPRENRVPIMMSEAELEAVDNWRFANRVATRSDAVRRLMQIGIVAHCQYDSIAKPAFALTDRLAEIDDSYEPLSDVPDDRVEKMRRAVKFMNAVVSSFDQIWHDAIEVNDRLVYLGREMSALEQSDDVLEGMKRAQDIRELGQSELGQWLREMHEELEQIERSERESGNK